MEDPNTLDELISSFNFDVDAFKELEDQLSEAFTTLEPHEARAAVFAGINVMSKIMESWEDADISALLIHTITVFSAYPQLLRDAENTF